MDVIKHINVLEQWLGQADDSHYALFRAYQWLAAAAPPPRYARNRRDSPCVHRPPLIRSPAASCSQGSPAAGLAAGEAYTQVRRTPRHSEVSSIFYG